MKKTALLLALLLFLPSLVWAQAANDKSLVLTSANDRGLFTEILLTFTCDSGDASFASTQAPVVLDGIIMQIITDPGTAAPQANYDIVLNNSDGIDVTNGALANRHTSTTELVFPNDEAGNDMPYGRATFGKHYIVITGNNVNSATGIIKILMTGM